ncbi:threonine-phosphate decarboxylase [Sulfitobacter albidus]|uniref:threonine-phosphate decarboxylase n=1 Tax=Sulfitobacter albidus TaxID=2829501 RepID=A0A975JCX1_9RHOB|nr:threonine-phosphate decarboxylase CobD [Sulfitobacter albidus]QUJ75780.1 threonine-phosphate decarboxylase [Sulfitobacter albidus]
MHAQHRDHGGGIDAAAQTYGGDRADWIDLSTGINPLPYDLPELSAQDWAALPDTGAQDALAAAARRFWAVPQTADLLATSGASAPIAMIPHLRPPGTVAIPAPTYNEHAAAFRAAGWHIHDTPTVGAQAQVAVHPNNPDGKLTGASDLTAPLRIIDESFCDVRPDASLIAHSAQPGTLILKSFGKFWGLAGLRLGFVIGDPELVAQLRERLGPWPVAGPALRIGAAALNDPDWAARTRARLHADAARLDALMQTAGALSLGGTTLFRLYEVHDAAAWQDRLARHHIWSRVFPYNPRWLRLGLPPASGWGRLARALT